MDYLKLAQIAGTFVGKLLGLKKDRKLEVADYLDGIAAALAEFPTLVRAGAPDEKLAALSRKAKDYASRFRDTTSDVLNQSDVASFIQMLSEVYDAKSALRDHRPEERDARLSLISQVAASFQVEAATLRASASRVGH